MEPIDKFGPNPMVQVRDQNESKRCNRHIVCIPPGYPGDTSDFKLTSLLLMMGAEDSREAPE
eukprot:2034516-Rhodomonas_salina.1